MSRNTQYRFVSTDAAQLEGNLIALYEKVTKQTVHPASPERLFLQWMASILLQERVQTNYAGNQNIPCRAEGENLDALGELFFMQKRTEAQCAVCTQRFYISQAQAGAVLVPAGTRVTDQSRHLVWETVQDAYIPAGETWVDVPIRCQTSGAVGNGYAVGQINAVVDLYDYYSGCGNITVSDGGSDRLSDDAYYALMRASMDGYSTAGALGGYIYHAKKVSPEIADVVPNSPMPGHVRIYVLMQDGTIASEEIKSAVLTVCNADKVRSFTDFVQMSDPETVPYDIDLTYYVPFQSAISAAQIEANVAQAVEEYQRWQSGRLGRDINPSELY
ncbi:MAG: baseplate J/gp47 family protein, partial [Oscillospiraceae bacterium]|nr:baseplate J/gp47 family protein [Oscillospiraceae bacterium]